MNTCLTDRARRLESIFSAIVCVDGDGAPADPYVRKMVVRDLLAIAAEQAAIAHEEAEKALDD